ncbi:hypothetical protein J6590_072033 [Homalodisca vitripennis]|nr:hypothetical protein J6590_072033 [Homalodisca vitripennis]
MTVMIHCDSKLSSSLEPWFVLLRHMMTLRKSSPERLLICVHEDLIVLPLGRGMRLQLQLSLPFF